MRESEWERERERERESEGGDRSVSGRLERGGGFLVFGVCYLLVT